ncbi:EH domain-containing protein 2-like [Lathyrus oleraceus]|uniref:EH domain-containing protein 2-like n=1 Tax=Pisum sativum TaxID=3888 RepID=UPI0021D14322|nr:EH domain-containing protein 2-like [Pisum sativum]
MGDITEMQQLLKLMGDNIYVSRYQTCEDEVTLRDIFWTHPDSIKLFNIFPTMLILDSTNKTNKYKLPLLEMVGVTSTEKTYSVSIIGHLKMHMPAMMGKAKVQQRLIDDLEDEFKKVQREFHLSAGDFPNVDHFREVLNTYNIDKFDKLKPKMIQVIDDMLGYEIPELLKKFRNPYE